MKKLTILLGMILLFATVGLTTSADTAVSAKPISAVPQAKPEKPLSKAAVDALVGELKEGLADLIEDEESVAAIVKKWDTHNLAGKTRTQILNALFADLKSVVKDKETQDSIWEGWKEVGLEDEEAQEEEEPPAKPPTQPAKPAETPAQKPATGNSENINVYHTGTIDSLDQSKKIGYIAEVVDGTKYFFHISSVNGRWEDLRVGQEVTFETKRVNNRVVAVKVTLV